MKPAVVLLSGGLDSSTCLALARSQGFDCHALSFDYGQRQRQELAAAQAVAQTIGVASHRILNLDMRAIGGSALTSDMAVPKHRSADEIGHGIPVTYVPARNTIFLSYALGLAEVLKANDIFIGVNALDYSGYPDCRPAFIQAFQTMANLATAAGVSGQSPMTIHTPLIDMTKAQIVRTALEVGLDIDMTFSCYDPSADGEPCGACDACLLRAKGIAEAQST
ncbi:7-cyano-7-deazaguanine synthase QueC [Betaproteobacteria bacterium LSUCC0115]|nr:7-cyano-7-deazaguanine synthase QueC [Burkholderiales bacterium LSUCC0115]